MAEEAATETAETTTSETTTTEAEEQRVPYERFQKANLKAKEAADRASKLEREIADLRAQFEERESAGLPELERERKRAEQLEKRAAEAEKRAEETERNLSRAQRERWAAQAASALNFVDPDDAARYLDLDDIEDADQAERAVKRVAKAKPHLLRGEEPKLPGRVLENGRTASPSKGAAGGIDAKTEAESLAAGLKQFTDRWHVAGS